MQPSRKTLEIVGNLGLRFPPANSVDPEAHAARVYLLAEDCADLPVDCLEEAASDWAKRSPFFPKACELRQLTLAIASQRARALLPSPKRTRPAPPPPAPPPLTDAEIRALPTKMRELGIACGDLTQERIDAAFAGFDQGEEQQAA